MSQCFSLKAHSEKRYGGWRGKKNCLLVNLLGLKDEHCGTPPCPQSLRQRQLFFVCPLEGLPIPRVSRGGCRDNPVKT